MVDGFARPGSPGLLGSSTVVRNATRVASLEQTSRFCVQAASLCGVHESLRLGKPLRSGQWLLPGTVEVMLSQVSTRGSGGYFDPEMGHALTRRSCS